MKKVKCLLIGTILTINICFLPSVGKSEFITPVYFLTLSNISQSYSSYFMELASYFLLAGSWTTASEYAYYSYLYGYEATQYAYYAYAYTPSGTATQANAYYAWQSLVAANDYASLIYTGDINSYPSWAYSSNDGQVYTGMALQTGAYGQ